MNRVMLYHVDILYVWFPTLQHLMYIFTHGVSLRLHQPVAGVGKVNVMHIKILISEPLCSTSLKHVTCYQRKLRALSYNNLSDTITFYYSNF